MHRHQALKNKIKRPRVSQAPFNVCLRARVPTAEGDAVGRNVGLSALLTYILADFKTSSRSWRNKTEGETLQVDIRGNASAGLCAQHSCGFHSLNLEGENKKSIWGGGVQRDVNIDNLLCNSLYWGRADLVSSDSPTIYCKLIITALGKTCSLCALNQSYACNVLNDPSIHIYRMYYYTLHQALTLIMGTKQLSVTLNWVAIKLD